MVWVLLAVVAEAVVKAAGRHTSLQPLSGFFHHPACIFLPCLILIELSTRSLYSSGAILPKDFFSKTLRNRPKPKQCLPQAEAVATVAQEAVVVQKAQAVHLVPAEVAVAERLLA